MEECGCFYTGKYLDGLSPSDEWFKQGKIVSVQANFCLLISFQELKVHCVPEFVVFIIFKKKKLLLPSRFDEISNIKHVYYYGCLMMLPTVRGN